MLPRIRQPITVMVGSKPSLELTLRHERMFVSINARESPQRFSPFRPSTSPLFYCRREILNLIIPGDMASQDHFYIEKLERRALRFLMERKYGCSSISRKDLKNILLLQIKHALSLKNARVEFAAKNSS